jgi:hypothetical protein
MAGTAMVAGTAAASARLGRSGDKLGPALETESGDFFAHLAAVALGTLDFGLIVEDDLLEILVAFGAVELKNRHSRSPLFKRISATEPTDWNGGIMEYWNVGFLTFVLLPIIPIFHFFYYNKGKGGKAIVNPFNDAMSQGTGKIPVLNFSFVVAGYRSLIARLMRVIHRYSWEWVTRNE